MALRFRNKQPLNFAIDLRAGGVVHSVLSDKVRLGPVREFGIRGDWGVGKEPLTGGGGP